VFGKCCITDSMRVGNAILIAVASGLLFRDVAGAQRPISDTRGSGVVSPSVVATAIIQYSSTNQAHLELLVLWRGPAGWMTRGGRTIRSQGTNPPDDAPILIDVSYGDVVMKLTFRSISRQLTVNGQEVVLGSANNVVLVDRVDRAPQVIDTLHIDPDAVLPSSRPTSIAPVAISLEFIRRSPRLVEYTRCDAPFADRNGAIQASMKANCDSLR
jgi:hypothetical protein